MTVGEAEMDRFMRAVRSTDSPRYYQPGELTPAQYGRMVRIVGGPLDGYEGRLLSVRGSRVKRRFRRRFFILREARFFILH